MSFEFEDYSPKTESLGRQSVCKPDYEKQAAQIKKNLDCTIRLKEALIEYADTNGTYPFRNIQSYAEMVGGVELTRSQQEKTYERLLKQIEEEK